MDNSKTWIQASGLTRGKAILVGVLAVVLVVVVYVQFGSGGAEEIPVLIAAADRPQRSRQAQGADEPPPKNSTKIDEDEPLLSRSLGEEVWEIPEVAKVIQHDPFALPSQFPRPAVATVDGLPAGSEGELSGDSEANQLAEAVERLRMELEELKQRGVHVIVKRENEYVAMIGDRTIHVGDEINGFTVTRIEPDGVHVERKVAE